MHIVQAPRRQQYPEIAVIDDNIHVIWIDNRSDPGDDYVLFYKNSTDAGFTWSEDARISWPDDALVDAKRNIGIAGRGSNLYVVYAKKTGIEYNVIFCRSTNNGLSWGGYYQLTSDEAAPPEPSITLSDDSIHVVYCTSNAMQYRATIDGQDWNSDQIFLPGLPRWPDIIAVNNIPHVVYSLGTVLEHSKPLPGGGWTEDGIVSTLNTEYRYPHMVVLTQGCLCVETEYVDFYRYGIVCYVSADDGVNWDEGGLNTIGEGADIAVVGSDSVMIAYMKSGELQITDVLGLNGHYSGGTFEWGESFKIAEYRELVPRHCCIANDGHWARHLVYHAYDYDGGFVELGYTANDDSLLSDTDIATAFNSAKHLIRDPFSGGLHIVYQSQGRVHYTISADNGESWVPYHILEKWTYPYEDDSGEFPSIGLVPAGMMVLHPCVVYRTSNEIKYQFKRGDGTWGGYTILAENSGLDPGLPAVATYDDQVYVAFSVFCPVGGRDFVSAIYFYQFRYDWALPTLTVIDQAMNGTLQGSNVSITIDGNGCPHVAWSKKLSPDSPEDIFYRWRDGENWQDILNISGQTYAPSTYPHLDDYGDWLAVVWHYDGDYEIYRRRKYIPFNLWQGATSYSMQYAICAYPVNAGVNFSFWGEIPVSQSDIRYRSDSYGWGWVSQADENECFCHSQLQRDWTPWDLYTIFTKGDEIPYRIACVHQQFGGGGSESMSALYMVETGRDTASVFCVQRDSAIIYNNYSIDYAANELSYNLSLLEPPFPYHLIRGTAYFEGSGKRTHELWINGQKKCTLSVNAQNPVDFEIPVSLELYRDTHKVNLSIRNPQGTGVYLADLEVYRLIDSKPLGGGGGPQSAGSDPLMSEGSIVLTPNPFREKTTVRYTTHDSRCPMLRIYDVSGRLIKSFDPVSRIGHHKSDISWDGCDDRNRQLPAGIYFVELKSRNGSITEKVIMLK